MKMPLPFTSVMAAALLLAGLGAIPSLSGATSLRGNGSPEGTPDSSSKASTMTKPEVVKKYVDGCRKKPAKEANCDKLRKDAVEILKEDLRTLGSSAKRTYVPMILKTFKSDEPELRIAAADAIGMIGPQDSDADLLAPLANDPVPDVRRAVGQMIARGKGPALTLLAQRTSSMRTGLTPETATDASKFTTPVAPESTYLFYASDAAFGRLTYVAKGMNETMAFFKGKAKKGPFKLEEFQERYRYQLEDEQKALEASDEENAKQMENVKPDPANMTAFPEKIQQVQAKGMSRTMFTLHDMYPPNIFGTPTVYVLEERQIGQRSYPTRYVVLYQDQALKMPGYRLSWMTVPDHAIKTAQVASLVREKEEEVRKKENEALKKREEALEAITRKKDEAEKKKFKKGQSDLEKELGF
ncbi:MAG: HEAT repeat domain-containing protein [Nitrospirota bacterium]|nr:HEAT repeat domain-containing protein [Nitrospirota bacterium]